MVYNLIFLNSTLINKQFLGKELILLIVQMDKTCSVNLIFKASLGYEYCYDIIIDY